MVTQVLSLISMCKHDRTFDFKPYRDGQFPDCDFPVINAVHSGLSGPAAARLLRLRVRIPPAAWMSVCVVCCEVEVFASG
jgi:hypothetical protein